MEFIKNLIMNFKGDADLFGRVDQNFLFAPEYLIFFAFATILAIALPLMLKRTKPTTINTVMICLWA